jgi:hypothetical protein
VTTVEAATPAAPKTLETPPATSAPEATPEVLEVPRELPASACEGYIDFIATRRTFGWAWCSEHPDTPVDVEIRIDGRPVVTACADKFRPDLARVGVGKGYHGFDVGLPEFVAPDEKHRVSAHICVAPGQPEVALINRTITAATPIALPAQPAKRPPEQLPAGPPAADGAPSPTPPPVQQPACSAQVRQTLSRVMSGQKAFEGSLSALAEEVRQLAAAGLGVDSRAESALAKAIDQLQAVQETLARQSAAM